MADFIAGVRCAAIAASSISAISSFTVVVSYICTLMRYRAHQRQLLDPSVQPTSIPLHPLTFSCESSLATPIHNTVNFFQQPPAHHHHQHYQQQQQYPQGLNIQIGSSTSQVYMAPDTPSHDVSVRQDTPQQKDPDESERHPVRRKLADLVACVQQRIGQMPLNKQRKRMPRIPSSKIAVLSGVDCVLHLMWITNTTAAKGKVGCGVTLFFYQWIQMFYMFFLASFAARSAVRLRNHLAPVLPKHARRTDLVFSVATAMASCVLSLMPAIMGTADYDQVLKVCWFPPNDPTALRWVWITLNAWVILGVLFLCATAMYVAVMLTRERQHLLDFITPGSRDALYMTNHSMPPLPPGMNGRLSQTILTAPQSATAMRAVYRHSNVPSRKSPMHPVSLAHEALHGRRPPAARVSADSVHRTNSRNARRTMHVYNSYRSSVASQHSSASSSHTSSRHSAHSLRHPDNVAFMAAYASRNRPVSFGDSESSRIHVAQHAWDSSRRLLNASASPSVASSKVDQRSIASSAHVDRRSLGSSAMYARPMCGVRPASGHAAGARTRTMKHMSMPIPSARMHRPLAVSEMEEPATPVYNCPTPAQSQRLYGRSNAYEAVPIAPAVNLEPVVKKSLQPVMESVGGKHRKLHGAIDTLRTSGIRAKRKGNQSPQSHLQKIEARVRILVATGALRVGTRALVPMFTQIAMVVWSTMHSLGISQYKCSVAYSVAIMLLSLQGTLDMALYYIFDTHSDEASQTSLPYYYFPQHQSIRNLPGTATSQPGIYADAHFWTHRRSSDRNKHAIVPMRTSTSSANNASTHRSAAYGRQFHSAHHRSFSLSPGYDSALKKFTFNADSLNMRRTHNSRASNTMQSDTLHGSDNMAWSHMDASSALSVRAIDTISVSQYSTHGTQQTSNFHTTPRLPMAGARPMPVLSGWEEVDLEDAAGSPTDNPQLYETSDGPPYSSPMSPQIESSCSRNV